VQNINPLLDPHQNILMLMLAKAEIPCQKSSQKFKILEMVTQHFEILAGLSLSESET
jgi:hypothetical protein